MGSSWIKLTFVLPLDSSIDGDVRNCFVLLPSVDNGHSSHRCPQHDILWPDLTAREHLVR